MENPCFPFLFNGWSLHIFQCPISVRASPCVFRDSAGHLPVGTYAGRFTPTLPGIYKLQVRWTSWIKTGPLTMMIRRGVIGMMARNKSRMNGVVVKWAVTKNLRITLANKKSWIWSLTRNKQMFLLFSCQRLGTVGRIARCCRALLRHLTSPSTTTTSGRPASDFPAA